MSTNYTPEFAVPDELEMIEALGTEPKEARPADGFWCFELTDSVGTTLRLSYDVFGRSLQTVLIASGHEIARVSQEGALSLKITSDRGGTALRGEFEYRDARATVAIRIVPRISVSWATLLRQA
jgi:hypothetical protein